MRCRLASINLRTGRIKYDPALRKKGRKKLFRGVKTHMETFRHERLINGASFTAARQIANKRERGRKSMKQWRSYNGQLGAIARWESKENK